jgi:hypothetical protein
MQSRGLDIALHCFVESRHSALQCRKAIDRPYWLSFVPFIPEGEVLGFNAQCLRESNAYREASKSGLSTFHLPNGAFGDADCVREGARRQPDGEP